MDAARRSARSTVVLPSRGGVTLGRGVVEDARHGSGYRRRRRRRPRAQLVLGLPARPVEGRIPALQRLGCRGWVLAPNPNGWQKVLHRQESQPGNGPPGPRLGADRLQCARTFPAQLLGRCFNFLSYSHRVATCHNVACAAMHCITLSGTVGGLDVLRRRW